MKKFDSYINWLNEKFIEDSDPIADMGIGMIYSMKQWMKSISEDFKDKDQALLVCSRYGKTDFVKYLLDAGADVHAYDDYALRWASYKGYVDVVKVLLDAGADVHAKDDDALIYASKYGYVDVDKVLKDHIAKEKKKIKEKLNEKFSEDSDPVHDMGIGIEKAMDDFFEDKLFPLYFKDATSRLRSSITYNKPEFVKYLVNKVSKSQLTDFLNYAIEASTLNLEIIKTLVEAGAELNREGILPPIYLACKRGNIDVVNYLIDVGAKITHGSFTTAATKGHIHILRLLLKRSKKVSEHTLKSALTYACVNGKVNTAEFLIKEGATLEGFIKDYQVKEWRRDHKRIRILKLLEKYNLI